MSIDNEEDFHGLSQAGKVVGLTLKDEWTSSIHCSLVDHGLDIERAALEPYVDGFLSKPEHPQPTLQIDALDEVL